MLVTPMHIAPLHPFPQTKSFYLIAACLFWTIEEFSTNGFCWFFGRSRRTCDTSCALFSTVALSRMAAFFSISLTCWRRDFYRLDLLLRRMKWWKTFRRMSGLRESEARSKSRRHGKRRSSRMFGGASCPRERWSPRKCARAGSRFGSGPFANWDDLKFRCIIIILSFF